MLLAASTQRTIGLVILALMAIGFITYIVFNIFAARDEVGSEIELAPNRKEYFDDDELETTKLDRSLGAGVLTLVVIGLALPLYWLGEPGRQEGRVKDVDRILTNRGEEIYEEGAQCVTCHGGAGSGGVVSTTRTDEAGNYLAQVSWRAPALNNILSRYSEDEIKYTLNFGRNGVMPAWGGPGGGPLTTQQIDEVVYYMRSIQIDEETMRDQVDTAIRAGVRGLLEDSDPGLFDELTSAREAAPDSPEVEAAEAAIESAIDFWLDDVDAVYANAEEMAVDANPELADEEAEDDLANAAVELLSDGEVPNSELYWTYGELIFTNNAGAGSYNCARCHTAGWSFDAASINNLDGEPLQEGYVQGGGWFGPNLRDGATLRQFDSAASHGAFITNGQTAGARYGNAGDGGNGQMPGFGPRTDDDLLDEEGESVVYPGQLTPEQINAVVAYERSLR